MISLVNILGVVLIFISVYLFKIGIEYKDDPGPGRYLTNISIIGGSVLLFILAIGFTFSSKSMCEIFGVLC